MLSLGDHFCELCSGSQPIWILFASRTPTNLAVDDYIFLGSCIAAVVSIFRALSIWENGYETTERRSKEIFEAYCALSV